MRKKKTCTQQSDVNGLQVLNNHFVEKNSSTATEAANSAASFVMRCSPLRTKRMLLNASICLSLMPIILRLLITSGLPVQSHCSKRSATMRQTLQGSFSAVSKPIFAKNNTGMRLKALAEMLDYKMHSFAQLCSLNCLSNNCLETR